MRSSFSTKMVVVTLFVSVCATQTNARRLYKWVDQGSVTNYSEFQPKEAKNQKLEVLESRGTDHVDPAMAVTAEMKPLEIPVDMANAASSPATSIPSAPQPAATQTIVKQGVIAPPYEHAASSVIATPVEKKEPVPAPQPVHSVEKKETTVVANPFIEKKAEVAVAAPVEKKIQPTVNPWTRTPNFVPSNLVPENLNKNLNNP